MEIISENEVVREEAVNIIKYYSPNEKNVPNIYQITGNSELFRTNLVNKLNILIENKTKSINLEKAIFNYTIEKCQEKNIIEIWDNTYFIIIYINKLKSILYNLKHVPNLLNNIKNNVLTTQDMVFMKDEELYPERWANSIEKKIIKDKNNFELKIEASTDVFKCRKCKKNNCTYSEVQVRSADESATIYISCLDCGNKWKQ